MRIPFKFIIVLLLVFGYITGMNWIIGGFESVTGLDLGGSGYAACYLVGIIVMIAALVTGYIMYKRYKKEKVLEASQQAKVCTRCGNPQIYLEQYGWYCEHCMRYD